MSRLSDRRALGDLPLQDHRPKKDVDVHLRAAVFACRVEDRDPFGRYIAQGHQGETPEGSTDPVKTIGDLLGGNFYEPEPGERETGCWSFAMPVTLTEPSKRVWTAARMTSEAGFQAREGEALPVSNEEWEKDERFKPIKVSVMKDAPSLYKGASGFLLGGTNEREQETLFVPAHQPMIAVNKGPDPGLSSMVYDLTGDNELDYKFGAPLHSMMRVVVLHSDYYGVDQRGQLGPLFVEKEGNNPQSSGSSLSGSLSRAAIAWQLGLSGSGDPGRGIVIDSTFRTSSARGGGSLSAIGCASARMGGPLEVGSGRCQHVRGEADIGHGIDPTTGLSFQKTPINALHLSTKSLFFNGKGDGPLFFENLPPKKEHKFPFTSPVHLRWDTSITHTWGGNIPGKGKWRWQAEIPIYVPEDQEEEDEEEDKDGELAKGGKKSGAGGDTPECKTTGHGDGQEPTDNDSDPPGDGGKGGEGGPPTDGDEQGQGLPDQFDLEGWKGYGGAGDPDENPWDLPGGGDQPPESWPLAEEAPDSKDKQKDKAPDKDLEKQLGLNIGSLNNQIPWKIVQNYISQGVLTAAGEPMDSVPRIGDNDRQRRILLGGVTSKTPTFAAAMRAAGGIHFRPFATSRKDHDLTRGGYIQRAHTRKQVRVPDTASLVGVGENPTGRWGDFLDDGRRFPGTPRTGPGGIAFLPPAYATPDGLQGVLAGTHEPSSASYPWTESTRAAAFYLPGGLASLEFSHPRPNGPRAGVSMRQTGMGMVIAPYDGAGSLLASTSLEIGAEIGIKATGNLEITGKLTVGGLIDPTGLDLVRQAASPISGSRYGLWSSDGTVAGTEAGHLYWDHAGTRVELSTGPRWRKFTTTYVHLGRAATTNDITLFELPAKGVIHSVVAKHSAPFGGGSISAYTVTVGVSGNLDKYLGDPTPFDVFQAAGNTVFDLGTTLATPQAEDFGSVKAINIAAVSTGANLDQASAGSVDVWVQYSVLP